MFSAASSVRAQRHVDDFFHGRPSKAYAWPLDFGYYQRDFNNGVGVDLPSQGKPTRFTIPRALHLFSCPKTPSSVLLGKYETLRPVLYSFLLEFYP